MIEARKFRDPNVIPSVVITRKTESVKMSQCETDMFGL